MRTRGRSVVGTVLVLACTFGADCSSAPAARATAPASAALAAAALTAALTPVLSVQELMEHVVDPAADRIFDAAAIDVSVSGTTETKPISDEDWLQVERGALLLAQSANLLKMPRTVAPAGTPIATHHPGQPAPELSPAEIQAKTTRTGAVERARRRASGRGSRVAHGGEARNADGLFDVGNRVDQACESCHPEYWYPGDKAAVLADQQKRVTYDPPKT